MKMCDMCFNNPANIHLTQIIHNKITVIHLCEECAKKNGISIEIEDNPVSTEMTVEEKHKGNNADKKQRSKTACPVCGMLFDEFRDKGRLGCASCYNAFEKDIDDLLVQVHGTSRHKGKTYSISQDSVQYKDDIKNLQNELHSAILNEKFELAALIRDKINNSSSCKKSGKRGR